MSILNSKFSLENSNMLYLRIEVLAVVVMRVVIAVFLVGSSEVWGWW